jgi:hypothetical protein
MMRESPQECWKVRERVGERVLGEFESSREREQELEETAQERESWRRELKRERELEIVRVLERVGAREL